MKDLKGQIFNSWTVLDEAERKNKQRVWNCQCKCGNSYRITQCNLTTGKSRMCRDCSRAILKELPKNTEHRLYATWKSMRTRCNNPNVQHYHNYGGRGIKVCERWEDFNLFIEDMFSTFEEGLTLDRKDNNLGYHPNNCRWADTETQMNNQEKCLSLLFEGQHHTEAQLARKTGVSRTTIQKRRNKGYSVKEMVYGR